MRLFRRQRVMPAPPRAERGATPLALFVDDDGHARLDFFDILGLHDGPQRVMTEWVRVDRLDDEDHERGFKVVATFSPRYELLAPLTVDPDDAVEWSTGCEEQIEELLGEEFEAFTLMFQDELIDVEFETYVRADATFDDAMRQLRYDTDVEPFVRCLASGPVEGFPTVMARLLHERFAADPDG